MLDRTQSPLIKDAIDFNLHLKPTHGFTLKNGVQVYAIDAGAQDVLKIEWVFYAGNSVEVQNGVAAATNHLLKNGTTTKTAFEINEHFDFYGAYCTRACYNETASITLHTLSKHLPVLLPVVQQIFSHANFTQDELATYQQNSKQKLSVHIKKCDFVANRLIDAAVFGTTHPYGKYSVAADYDALNTTLLKSHYQQHYINGHCVIFVAGKLPVDIEAQLNNNFGNLPLKNHTTAATYLQKATTEPYTFVPQKTNIVNDENGVQAAIRIARPFPNRHHPDFQKVMVLNTLFGGFFGSRLMSNIREDKGYTYGIHSYLQNHIGNTTWMISTEAGKEVSAATIEEVYKEMQLLQTELIDEEELLLVKNYMIGIILGDLDGPFQIIGRWKNIILNNLDADYFYDSINIIKTISAEELSDLAKKYLNPNHFYQLVVV